jgi:hypothetical protein
VNFVLSALTEAILSRSTDLAIFSNREIAIARFRTSRGQAVGESCPYFGGSAPDDPPSSLQILHEASRDAELPCGDNGS